MDAVSGLFRVAMGRFRVEYLEAIFGCWVNPVGPELV